MKLPIAIKTSVAIILLVSTIGCATMFNGANQTITIRSNHADTKFYVNEAYIGASNTVTLFKKKKNYIIRATREGYEDVTIYPTKSFDPITLLGILVDWGIVSIFIVDGMATGAWQQFDQTNYIIDPEVVKLK